MASDSLGSCHYELVDKWLKVKDEYEAAHSEYRLRETCGYRSPEEQARLYAHGRNNGRPIVTQIDGVTRLGRHNQFPAEALDFVVLIGGKVTWDPDAYAAVGAIAKRYGLVWGGDWEFKDLAHLQLPGPNSIAVDSRPRPERVA